MKTTAQSEFGKLDTVFIKHVRDAFMDDEKISAEWKPLGYTGRPNREEAISEYEAFEQLLRNSDVKINYFPKHAKATMDSIYCRDASIVTDGGVILCNMGKAARMPEPAEQRKAFENLGVRVLGSIQPPGTLEGGDAAWLDETTLAVGHTYRTNAEGIRQLDELTAPLGITLMTVPLPHYKGPADVFHLMSVLSPVDRDLMVAYSPLMPIAFRNELLSRGISLVDVDDEEFVTMGCNVLALAPRQCMMVSGNPKTKRALEEAGCTVVEYNGEEISLKGGGGPTCLTRPLLRQTL